MEMSQFLRIPVLRNHDYQDVVGVVEIRNQRLVLRTVEPITKEMVFNIFPNAGFVLKLDENEAEIYEFSLI